MHPCRGCSTKTSPSKNRQPSRLYKGACPGSQNRSPKSTPCLSRISLTASPLTSLAIALPAEVEPCRHAADSAAACIKLSFAQIYSGVANDIIVAVDFATAESRQPLAAKRLQGGAKRIANPRRRSLSRCGCSSVRVRPTYVESDGHTARCLTLQLSGGHRAPLPRCDRPAAPSGTR
jgi:hypothetical protein